MPPLKRGNGEPEPWFDSGGGSSDSDPERKVDEIGQNFRHPRSDRDLFERLPGQWDLLTGEPNGVFGRLRYGELDHETAWKAYRETLLVVLEEVTTLLRSVDAERVVITSDHGNAFGEWGFYGHPMHMPFSVLREVPFVATSATAEIDYTPPEYDTRDTADRDEQLRALGYR
jgi:hypothetical protein